MPWDANSFKKHNKKLSAAESGKAARQANAILAKTGDDGLAIRVANANAKKRRLGLPFGMAKARGE
jgi:uncharacterized protein YdaT